MATRSSTLVWLIGHPEENLPCNSLPRGVDLLRTFYHYELLNNSVLESRNITIEKLLQIWEKAHIPCAEKRSIVVKFNSLLEQYKLLKKSKGRATDTQKGMRCNIR